MKLLTRPRKQAVQPRAKATVDAILKATAQVLVRDGYDRASTNRIAVVAGVSIGSLYQYFPSKEALVAALIEQHRAEMSEVLRGQTEQVATLPLADAIEHVVRAMIAAHAVDPALHKVLVEQVPRVGRLDRLQELEREALALARMFFELRKHDLRPDLDLDMAALIVVATVEALTHGAVLHRPDLLGDRLTHEIRDLVFRYLAPLSAPVARGRRRTTTRRSRSSGR